jgi:hypothetical protein
MSGYIYCFSNESLDGIYKIGFTTRDITSRLGEMNRPATHRLCDDIYKIEFAKKIDDCRETERIIHTVLETLGARLYPNREFFKISLPFIKSLFNLYEGEWYDNELVNRDKVMVSTNPIEPIYTCEKTNDTEEKVEIIKRDEIINLIDDGITCKNCGKIYSNNVTFNKHITLNRCKNPDDSLLCRYCKTTFKNKYIRKTHETRCGNVTTIEKIIDDRIKRLLK